MPINLNRLSTTSSCCTKWMPRLPQPRYHPGLCNQPCNGWRRQGVSSTHMGAMGASVRTGKAVTVVLALWLSATAFAQTEKPPKPPPPPKPAKTPQGKAAQQQQNKAQ